ncbi:MAG TPA: XRE family transcriptional regulator [Pseudonocardiaceae bacterium]|nr:XRE family transcriptional regulator [Pseudonocardiaceae bacterium]
MNRKQFIHRALGASALGALETLGPVLGSLAALLGADEPAPVPTRVGACDIEQIRTAESVFAGWDFAYGGGLVKEAVMGQLRYCARLLDATCPERLRPELHAAVGALADTAGYMCFDTGAYDQARRVFRFALACAEQAEDWQLRAYVLNSMALLAIRTGQPDEGLALAEQGLVRPDRLTETGQWLLHIDRARALAKMRRIQDTLTAVGTAEDHFSRVSLASEPPFLAHYNVAFLAGNTGQALFDLAIVGHDPARAIDRLTTAVDGHTTGYTRPRAICMAKLASLTMATGDPLQAALLGIDALDTAAATRSRRVADDLRELAHHAAAHQHLDEVAHLRHRIATLLTHTASA